MSSGQPPEITVTARVNDTWADVTWMFRRHMIHHYFSMQVLATGFQPSRSFVKDQKFTIAKPTGDTEVELLRKRGVTLPRRLSEIHATHESDYVDMIDSILKIIAANSMIEEAQTNSLSYVARRDDTFVYPKWFRRKSGYNPTVARASLLGLTTPVINGTHELPVPGNGAVPGVVDIIRDHMPAPEEDPYITALGAMKKRIENMRAEIHTVAKAMAEREAKIYMGYDKLLVKVLQEADTLLVARGGAIPDMLMARLNKVLGGPNGGSQSSH